MYVVNRHNVREKVSFDRILNRIERLSSDLQNVNPTLIAQKVCSQLEDGISTSRLDEFSAETAMSMTIRNHPQYGVLATRIVLSNHHKNTPDTFQECCESLGDILSDKILEASKDPVYQSMIDYSRDTMFDYFGFKTIEKGYLLRKNEKVIERPQHMWMRVALELWVGNTEKVKRTYDALSQGYFIHATPTLFNAGTRHTQLSSCFLVNMKEDSIKGIYSTLSDCAQISKWAGGVGLSISEIRAKHSHIKGTNGSGTGIVPMLKVFNDTAKYVNQGGRRNGSFAAYLEMWHADVEDFLKLKLNTGAEEDRARDLFYALWIPDLFMRRVEANEDWSLMCPNECPGLTDCWGEAFEELYLHYESQQKMRKTIPAQKLWAQIMTTQIETGMPYLLYKDACNRKSNQQNMGTIKSSNLCAEIIEYSSPTETAVCNLGSMSLSKFVREGEFDFLELEKYTRILAENLDRVIDVNFYPTPECSTSNMRLRPIGIGVQGLADVFAKLKIAWTSREARELNRKIFDHMYYAAIQTSVYLALENGPYEKYEGSPASRGILQPDVWPVDDTFEKTQCDFQTLKQDLKRYGLRNSLSIALMPTASTSQILGNTECFEPPTSNLFTRHVLSGDFIVLNKYLVEELLERNLWTPAMRNSIIAMRGSIQGITEIPEEIRERFKTIWEIPQKVLIDMSRDRAPFVCQSQSLNLFVADPVFSRISSMHMYAWKQGLKTGCYYLRTRAIANAQQFTVEPPCVTCSA